MAAVDLDNDASVVYRENLGTSPLIGDLRKISGAEILSEAGLKRGEVSVCVGCPPCQGFSTLRKTRLEKGQRDNRKSLLKVFADRVEEILPKVVILENVRGLSLPVNVKFLENFVDRIRGLGYSSSIGILNAADYGVPQRRMRLILIGEREGLASLPQPSHFNPKKSKKQKVWRTVRNAIRDLPTLRAGESSHSDPLHRASSHSESVLRIIRNIPQNGGGRRSLPPYLWLPCHQKLAAAKHRGAESIYGRMRWDSPSPTITTRSHIPSCGRFVHPSQNRGITLREAARLQSIPDTFKIAHESKDRIAQWIGNAMPLGLAEELAEHVRTNIL